ncbi:MAG: hypothetical protein U0941_01795 [Planctomycetaceae bacterium]
MRTVLILSLIVLCCGYRADGQSQVQGFADLLQFTEGDRTHEVGVSVEIDGLSFDEYWTRTIDAVFNFADANADGTLSDDEVKLVPSARAVRLALGSGFTPPVDAIRSLSDVGVDSSKACSKADLQAYYRRHGAACLTISYGKLPHTSAITARIVKALDVDRDGKVSEGEFGKAESTLRRVDGNDDELIGVGELVADGTYPGNWATNAFRSNAQVDLSPVGDRSLILRRIPSTVGVPGGTVETTGVDRTVWALEVSGQVEAVPLIMNTKARLLGWPVHATLNELFDEFSRSVAKPGAETTAENSEATGRRRGRVSREWLIALVDRDRNGQSSEEEVRQWLEVQRRIVRGQVLVSLYYGGGLFEMLDSNHDAGLSVRELRNAWAALKGASCTSGDFLELGKIPSVVFLVASQGYPSNLVKEFPSGRPEWFRQMDRNFDGDVSRREFTGSSEVFNRLDGDRDGMVSMTEAAAEK